MPFYNFENANTGEIVEDFIFCTPGQRPDTIDKNNYEEFKKMITIKLKDNDVFVYKASFPQSEPHFKGTGWTDKGDHLYMTEKQKKRLQNIKDNRRKLEDKGILDPPKKK